ncbi:glutamate receptor ionotropic, kainate 3 [Nasonia vitripennis]|uniref:Ionotropic receptor 76b n=1 Tax=Nasonia vitripennis TaxID=7425 RepID=A0A7M7H868_NASVI|nr:glutamate receptor ionotropic, kainate 3 [Nasonia vitripennis]
MQHFNPSRSGNAAMGSQDEPPPFPSHIKITTYNDWPFSRYREENGTIIGEGYAFELLKLLIRKFNFTYTIVPPREDIIGNEERGMLQQIYDGEVDMAVAFIPILSSFRNICDYSAPLDEMDTTFLLKRPGTSATGSGLTAPFSTRVWYLILISLLVVGPTIYLIIYLRGKFARDEKAEKFTFLTCMWFVYGALLKQGTTASPMGDSTRLVFATWWIFITILTSFYTANLTAFLTLSRFTLGVNSLDELVYGRYSWVIVNGRSIHTLLPIESDDTRMLVKSKSWGYGYVTREYNMSYNSILKKVKDGRVFILERTLAQMAIFEDYRNKTRDAMDEERKCTYVISESNVLARPRGFAFPVGSTIKQHVNSEMIPAVEGGLVKHFKLEKLPQAQICPLNLKSKERRLKVSDLMMTYKVVFAGMGVGVIIFLMELFTIFIRWVARHEAFRNCCRRNEVKGPSEPEDPWDYPKKTDTNFWIRTPPPVYQMNEEVSHKTYSINGRDYYIVKEETGDQRLIPIRTPSAYLFQYIH